MAPQRPIRTTVGLCCGRHGDRRCQPRQHACPGHIDDTSRVPSGGSNRPGDPGTGSWLSPCSGSPAGPPGSLGPPGGRPEAGQGFAPPPTDVRGSCVSPRPVHASRAGPGRGHVRIQGGRLAGRCNAACCWPKQELSVPSVIAASGVGSDVRAPLRALRGARRRTYISTVQRRWRAHAT